MFQFQFFKIPKTLSHTYCTGVLRALEKVVPSTSSGGTKKPQQGIINLIVISEEEMARMNKQFRGKEGPTDILTFSYYEGGQKTKDKRQNRGSISVIPESGDASEAAGKISGIQTNKLSRSEAKKTTGNNNNLDPDFRRDDGEVVGEIYLCLEKIKTYAQERGVIYKEQLAYIIIHGLVHLMGYDHENDTDWKKMEKIEKKIQSEIEQ